jgi:hypothetical protein
VIFRDDITEEMGKKKEIMGLRAITTPLSQLSFSKFWKMLDKNPRPGFT